MIKDVIAKIGQSRIPRVSGSQAASSETETSKGGNAGCLFSAHSGNEIARDFADACFWIVRVGYNPIQNGWRRNLRTLNRQSTSRVGEVLCVLPESVLFGVYRQRLSSH